MPMDEVSIEFLSQPHDELKREPDDADRLNNKERVSQGGHLILLDFSRP